MVGVNVRQIRLLIAFRVEQAMLLAVRIDMTARELEAFCVGAITDLVKVHPMKAVG